MRYILISIVFALACTDDKSSKVKDNEDVIVTESGKRGAAVECMFGRTDCLKKISKVCPNGYKILKEDIASMVAECQ